ncbi:hypothetical protein M422DRAFT_164369 [Sphaerobolus stellatus SS14]|uniref:FAD-binding PCMH-type domain-containing protein n=1 Tax=Sphaerobolus stellatus (strain SS14) TaxID=990650 RepID=A0A0C9VIH2_SPHS4|nr:hypothetical protein M422DRAFT_164369 [Sphaerobolus stellatus SS14]
MVISHGVFGGGDSPVFSNWGGTVTFQPGKTLVVRSIKGVQEVVRWAAKEGKKVRVSGFRHTWSDLYGSKNDIIIMFLPYDTLVDIPYKSPPPSWFQKSEFSGIKLVDSVAGRTPPEGHMFCNIMAGTTNEQLRAWSFANRAWCIPFNVIMVEITFGGSNAPICHGSGLSTTTLSDLVVEVQYVDAKGDLQIVNDPAELRAASGCFGLLGVVVSLTLQLDTMGVTDMMPVKKHVALAIPPPEGYQIPDEVRSMMKADGITAKQLAQAKEEFIQRIEKDYYLEWFWFPYQRDCWVNTWSKRSITSSDVNIQNYPGDGFLQPDGVTAQNAVVNFPVFKWLSGQDQAYILGRAAMWSLPHVSSPANAIKTFVSEALHFRRGIQNFRCLDSEWEIPIPKTTSGGKDYTTIQKAWWDAITIMYSRKDAPVRVALEMRLTGGSNVILAPQKGNEAGTISIEVLTTTTTPKDNWKSCLQELADKWTSYTDNDGKLLNARPHWAKQWSGLTVRKMPIEKYFREVVYKEAFGEFKEQFGNIVRKRGGTVEETLKRFGTATMEGLLFAKA